MPTAKPTRIAETQIGKAVVQWLEEEGWDVYQEVPLNGATPDVVGIRGSVVMIVECKTSFSLDVMAQAQRWVSRGALANLIYVAVPQEQKPSDGRAFGVMVLRGMGIGVIEVNMKRIDAGSRADYFIRTRQAPLHRHADTTTLLNAIRPEHKTFCAAGTAIGKRYTPFMQTASAIARFVATHPGCTVGDAVRGIKMHHYNSDNSALSSIGHWAERGKIPGVRVEMKGKKRTLVVADPPNPTTDRA